MYLPQLTTGPSAVAWAADARSVVFSMAGSLWQQKLDSTVAEQLTSGPDYDYQPDCSSDGHWVVYASYARDAVELWSLNLETKATRQLTATHLASTSSATRSGRRCSAPRTKPCQPGYHQNKKHWNTIVLDGSVPDDEVEELSRTPTRSWWSRCPGAPGPRDRRDPAGGRRHERRRAGRRHGPPPAGAARRPGAPALVRAGRLRRGAALSRHRRSGEGGALVRRGRAGLRSRPARR